MEFYVDPELVDYEQPKPKPKPKPKSKSPPKNVLIERKQKSPSRFPSRFPSGSRVGSTSPDFIQQVVRNALKTPEERGRPSLSPRRPSLSPRRLSLSPRRPSLSPRLSLSPNSEAIYPFTLPIKTPNKFGSPRPGSVEQEVADWFRGDFRKPKKNKRSPLKKKAVTI
jgi:hypothetical protein